MRIISLDDISADGHGGVPTALAASMTHRKIISLMSGGPGSFDLGYNTYAAGMQAAEPFVYTKDEVCYTAAGSGELYSRGVKTALLPGQFMWRPAGAVSDGGRSLTKAVTICAFAPARDDASNYRLSPEPWDGDEKTRFIPTHRHFLDVEPTPYPGAPAEAGIVHRMVFTKERDGSAFLDVGHTSFPADVELEDLVSPRDEVWWLESGALVLFFDGTRQKLTCGDFFYRGAGERLERLQASVGSVVVFWSALPVP